MQGIMHINFLTFMKNLPFEICGSSIKPTQNNCSFEKSIASGNQNSNTNSPISLRCIIHLLCTLYSWRHYFRYSWKNERHLQGTGLRPKFGTRMLKRRLYSIHGECNSPRECNSQSKNAFFKVPRYTYHLIISLVTTSTFIAFAVCSV